MGNSFSFLSAEQITTMAHMAEQARSGLSRYVGDEVGYDATGLQLLDEWIERHLRQFPIPSQRIRLLWVSFLGEVFRRSYGGEWARKSEQGQSKQSLIILCPLRGTKVYPIDVSEQVGKRIAQCISASLTYFYTMTSIEIRAQQ